MRELESADFAFVQAHIVTALLYALELFTLLDAVVYDIAKGGVTHHFDVEGRPPSQESGLLLCEFHAGIRTCSRYRCRSCGHGDEWYGREQRR